MSISYEPIRGFRDYTPPESELISWICESFSDVVKRFGYREIRTPTVESFQLFALKSGEEIRESMFVFKDKAGREVALRPEITPSVIRVYLKEMRHFPKPIRLYYIGNVFRYDEPQFGRYREFTQAGVEILGGDELYYDVELIEILEEFYDAINLRNRRYKVNNIAIFRELARRAGIEGADMDRLLHYLDKGMYSEAVRLFVSRGAYEEARALEGLASIGRGVDKLEAMKEVLLSLNNHEMLAKHISVLEKYTEMVKSIGADIAVEPSFARGIAYYTDIIFEVSLPTLSISIAGGGRYDNLSQVYGGESLSTTGFAIGVERTMIALTNSGVSKAPEKNARILFLLLVDDRELYSKIYTEIVRDLRRKGLYVQLEISTPSRLSKWLEYASRYGVEYVVIVGRRELDRGVATVRDMRNWVQREIQLKELHSLGLQVM